MVAWKKGTEVEVTSVDDGFRGVWYLAKITQPPKKSEDGFVLVEYNELVSDEDETKKLCEKVHVELVRPLAPSGIKDDDFEINDVVDVYHKDGWWVGVVEKVLSKDEVLVAFDDPPDKITAKRLDVRFHFDWINGKWVKPDKKIKNSSGLSMLSDYPGNSERQDGSAQKQHPGKSCASTEKKGTDMNDEIVEKVCDAEEVDMFVKEIKGVSAKNCETPPKKHQNSKVLDQELQTLDDFDRPMLSGYSRRQKSRAKKQQAGKRGASTEKTTTGIHDEVVEKEGDAEKVDTSVKEVKGVSAKNCETLLKKFQQNKSMDQEMHTIDDPGRLAMVPNHSGSSTRRSKRVKTQQAEKGSLSTEKKGNTGVHVDIVEKEFVTGAIKGTPFAKDCETSQKKDQKKQSTDREITTVDSTNGSTQGDVSSKRKRGKQIGNRSMGDGRILQNMNMEDSWVGNEAEINAENRLMQTPVDIKSSEKHVQPSSNGSLKVTADEKRTSVCRHSDLPGETEIVPLPEDLEGETVPSKRVRRLKNSLSNEHKGMSKLDKFQNASLGNASLPETHHVKDFNMLMDGNLGDVNDDQVSNSSLPVAKPSPTGTLHVQRQCANANGRLDNFGTPPVAKKDRVDNTNGPKLSSAPGDLPVKFFNQADKNGELGTPASVSIDNMENNQSLPFIKRSPLWKAIESMEIYKRLAQRPHFSPLVKLNEETREGLAIAHMVNFSNLAEKITKLKFSDPITVIERNMETLAELETNGFNVERIRAILTHLLSMKQKGEELQKEYQDIEYKISDSLNEIERVDEEIIRLNQKMEELVAKLGDVVSRKEMKDRVHSTLKSEQDVVSQRVKGLQLEFQNIAGSLCQGCLY
ncbi:DUF724 domain-containing protein 6-like isoform X2 [Apium graveolens]|uniref:DUF724 domain-containing protein 6-like isoform X2 n=1 Tax=Apium graveolens TaxID=4045 RepID=UPI003D7B631B